MPRPLFTLEPRLQLCADWVRPGVKMADIGTDHGYLPIWLASRERFHTELQQILRWLLCGPPSAISDATMRRALFMRASPTAWRRFFLMRRTMW